MIFKTMNADKLLWPIFGCKVGESVPIGMKLENVEKKPGKPRKIQNAQNCQNFENNIFTKIGTYVKKYTAGHLWT